MDEWLQAARDSWKWRGHERPAFAIPPGPGQESVWDYPRPPILVPDPREIIVRFADHVIASTTTSVRLLETAHPPTFYIPRTAIETGALSIDDTRSFCEWKGPCTYYDVTVAGRSFRRAAWSYETPLPGAELIAGHVAFYATELECFVAGERVTPQPGGFYGGWITSELVGPFKGEPGSSHW